MVRVSKREREGAFNEELELFGFVVAVAVGPLDIPTVKYGFGLPLVTAEPVAASVTGLGTSEASGMDDLPVPISRILLSVTLYRAFARLISSLSRS